MVIVYNYSVDIGEETMMIIDEVGLWQENLKIRLGDTARTYHNGVKHFLCFLEEQKIVYLDQLTPQIFIDFVLWLSTRSPSGATKALYNTGVKSFYNWLIIKGLLDATYMDEVKYKKVRKSFSAQREAPLARTPDKGAAEQVVRYADDLAYQADGTSSKGLIMLRNAALVKCLYSSGCRISELLALSIKDIQGNKAMVLGKGQKKRYIFFDDAALSMLNQYHAYLSDNAPLFCRHDRGAGEKVLPITSTTGRAIITKLKDGCGVSGIFTPHSFRHNFGIKVLKESKNLALTQDLMGHADPKSTRHYAKIRVDDLSEGHSTIFNGNC